ncbi:MAG: nucleoside hydrolase [Chloroflexi bacterium]|jgi:inosine-uridine nucleoside N-ribohydrolase|nr:nucleoside hydrolase [Chloroflexota bacterium]MBT4755975.1 nucleoside hydrolase [Chloroflexota bacterium]MBT6358429.1 nucleoside hydrolase [Chloroflexota bacterium]
MMSLSNKITKKIPVIVETDIGSDMDDMWALIMMLKSPEFDIKLIVSGTGDTYTRTKLIAKTLELAGRTDIEVGVGIPLEYIKLPQSPWVEDYDLDQYPGKVHTDGVGAMVDMIMEYPEEMTLLCLGPLPNIAAALNREPRIAEKSRFVGMFGSIRKGYMGAPDPISTFNIGRYAYSAQKVFTAPWDMTVTPTDTCSVIRLTGEKYYKVRDCESPLIQALIENYRIWKKSDELADFYKDLDTEEESSILFDTVAVYLAFSDEWLKMEKLGLRVTADGFTKIDDTAKVINCAMEWKDQDAFEDFLVDRLIS